MPFDGINYGRVGLIPPYYYHPHAPNMGDCLAISLAGAFLYSRKASNLIGYQTYRIFESIPSFWNNVPLAGGTSLTTVGQFRRRLPAHATHVRARIIADVRNSREANFGVQVSVTDSATPTPNTDTGTEQTQTVDQQDEGFSPSNADFIFDAEVELSTVSLPDVCTIAVDARCTHANGGGAVNYRPFFAVAWMEVRG